MLILGSARIVVLGLNSVQEPNAGLFFELVSGDHERGVPAGEIFTAKNNQHRVLHVINALDSLDFVDIFCTAMHHVHEKVLCLLKFFSLLVISNQNIVVDPVYEWNHFVLHLGERHFRQHFSIQHECSKDKIEALSVDSGNHEDSLAHVRVLGRTQVGLCVEILRLFSVQPLSLQRNLVAPCQKLRHRHVAEFELVEAVVLNCALVRGHLAEFTPGVFLDDRIGPGAHKLL